MNLVIMANLVNLVILAYLCVLVILVNLVILFVTVFQPYQQCTLKLTTQATQGLDSKVTQ